MSWFKKQYAELKYDAGNPFIAAYSAKPFANQSADPALDFYEDDQGRHWCVRSGDFRIQWGIGEGLDYKAHGTVILSRRRMKASTFKNVPSDMYMNDGDVCYLYVENMVIDDVTNGVAWRGYAPYIRETILQPLIRRIACRVSVYEFPTAYQNLKQEPEMIRFLEDHKLDFKDAYLG